MVEPARAYALKGGASVAEGLLQLTLSVLIAFFFFRDGDAIVARLRGAVGRIAPDRGLHMLQVALDTTRAVVYGILGTALAQGVLMAIGLWIAGFKAAPLLGLLTFFLSPVPIGPPLVWIPTSLILIMRGDHGVGRVSVPVGISGRLVGRQLHQADDHQLRHRPAVHPRAAGRVRRRRRVRLHRRVPGPGAAGTRLRADQGMGWHLARRRAPRRRRTRAEP